MSYLDYFRRVTGQPFNESGSRLTESDDLAVGYIRKLAKKTKMGDYSPTTLALALGVLEPGWKSEVTIGLVPLKDEELNPATDAPGFWHKWAEDHGLDAAYAYGTDIGIGFVYSPEWPADSNYPETQRRTEKPSKEEISKTIDAFLDLVLMRVTQEKDPANPEEGRIYINPLGKPKTLERPVHPDAQWRYGKDAQSLDLQWKLSGVRKAVRAVRITSPDGDFYDIEDNGKTPPAGVWTWLYKKGIDKKAAEWMAGSGQNEKDAKKKALKNYSENEYLGTCGVCGNVQKLKGRNLVLHGYQRPGFGWINGKCFGVGYEPWELSSKAAEDYIKALASKEKTTRSLLAGVDKQKSFIVFIDDTFLVKGSGKGYRKYEVTPEEFKLLDDKKHSYSDIKNKARTVSPYKLDAEQAAKVFKDEREGMRRSLEFDIKQMVELQATFKQRVAAWMKAPLPGAQLESLVRDFRRLSGM